MQNNRHDTEPKTTPDNTQYPKQHQTTHRTKNNTRQHTIPKTTPDNRQNQKQHQTTHRTTNNTRQHTIPKTTPDNTQYPKQHQTTHNSKQHQTTHRIQNNIRQHTEPETTPDNTQNLKQHQTTHRTRNMAELTMTSFSIVFFFLSLFSDSGLQFLLFISFHSSPTLYRSLLIQSPISISVFLATISPPLSEHLLSLPVFHLQFFPHMTTPCIRHQFLLITFLHSYLLSFYQSNTCPVTRRRRY